MSVNSVCKELIVIGFELFFGNRNKCLAVDGIVGARTWDALLNSVTTFYTVTIRHIAYDVADAIVKQYGGELIAERG